MITEILSFISSPVTEYIKGRREIKKAKHDRELAVINNQTRLAASEKEYNHEWEMQSLKGNSKGLRFFCFLQFSIPIMITCVWPEKGKEIFQNLEAIPEGFMSLYTLMIASIWGISELKNAAPAIVGGLIKSVRKDIDK